MAVVTMVHITINRKIIDTPMSNLVCHFYQPHSYCFLLPLVLLIVVQPSLAGEWEIEPSIYVAASTSDNVFISPPGTEKSDSIAQINPAININGEGRRGNVKLNYEMQNIYYNKYSEFNDTFHIWNATGNLALLPDLLFIDGSLGRSQQIISRNGSIPQDNLTISANRANVDVFSASPYLKTNIGKELSTEIRYREARSSYDQGPLLRDSRNKSINAELKNDLTSSRTQWALYYNDRKFIQDSGRTSTFQRSYVDINYSVTARVGLLASAGYEDNGYSLFDTTRSEEGSTWDVGVRWSNGRDNRLTARIGERVFGKIKLLDFNYVTQRWTWSAMYNEEFRNNLAVLVNNQQRLGNNPNIIAPGDPTPTTEVFLSRRFDLGATRSYGKTTMDFSVYDRKREYQISNDRENIAGGRIDLVWRFQKRSNMLFGAQYQNQKLRDGFSNDNLIIGTFGIDREIFRDAKLALNYRYYQRDSNSPTRSDYRQNQVTLGLMIVF